MIKKIVVALAVGVLGTALVVVLLGITKAYTFLPLVSFIRKMSCTEHYTGEERGHVGMRIVFGLILIIFIIMVATAAIILRKRRWVSKKSV